MNPMRYRSSGFVLAMTILSPVHAATERQPIGFIESITGDVKLNEQKLDPTKDAGRILYAGESIRCVGSATVLIQLDDGPHDCKSAPSAIAKIHAGEGARSLEQLEKYKLAGRAKGTESPIYSPPEGGAVMAGKFVTRWRIRPPLGKLTVALRNGKGAELWHLENVDGASGELDSDAARKALTAYRDNGDSIHQAKLVFKDEAGVEVGVAFTVLTREQERALEKELGQLNTGLKLFHHVQRASVFDSYRMYDMVAAEYDLALNDATESRDLLRAAMNAHARTGNLSRARELRDQLSKVEEPDAKP